jgi:hypothetical protein
MANALPAFFGINFGLFRLKDWGIIGVSNSALE